MKTPSLVMVPPVALHVVVPDAVPNGPVNLSVGYSETRSNAITIYVQ